MALTLRFTVVNFGFNRAPKNVPPALHFFSQKIKIPFGVAFVAKPKIKERKNYSEFNFRFAVPI